MANYLGQRAAIRGKRTVTGDQMTPELLFAQCVEPFAEILCIHLAKGFPSTLAPRLVESDRVRLP